MTIFNFGGYKRKQDINISTAYKAFLPCAQPIAAGGAIDRSGQGNDASDQGATLSDAAMWAVAGYASSINGDDSGFGIPNTVSLWNLAAGESLVFMVEVDMPIPIADGVLGNFKTGTQGAGLRWVANSADSINVTVKDVDNNVSANAIASGVLDGTPHKVIVTIDAITKALTVYVDAISGATGTVSNITGATAPSDYPFNFGNDGDTAVGKTYDGSFRDIHILSISGSLPSNILEIVNLYQSRYYTPFSVDEIGV